MYSIHVAQQKQISLKKKKKKDSVYHSAVITWSNIVRYYINNYRNWGRILIRCWIHKRYPIPHPSGQAMGCLTWIFVRKLTTLLQHRTVSTETPSKEITHLQHLQCLFTCIHTFNTDAPAILSSGFIKSTSKTKSFFPPIWKWNQQT